MSAMFSQDFFLAIILQDSSPGEGWHGTGYDVGRGRQGEQQGMTYELGCRAGVVWSARGGGACVTGSRYVCMGAECLSAFVWQESGCEHLWCPHTRG